MECFIGLDLGTSNVKVLIMDEQGVVITVLSRSYLTRHPLPTQAEQSPEDWWEATRACIREATSEEILKGRTIRSIGLSGQMHGLVLLDKALKPIRDAIIWPDRRATESCRLRAASPRMESFKRITGLPLATGFLAPSLEWVRDNEPDVYRASACFMLPKDYIRFRLTGVVATDPTDASGTYLFDIRKGSWSKELFEEFGLAEALEPEIIETMSSAGTVTKEAAAETGLSPGTPVIAGGSDQSMAALALGANRPGVIAAAISTGGTLITTIEKPLYDPRLHTLRHVYPDRWLMMGATLSAGAAIAWFNQKILGRADDKEGWIPGAEIEDLTRSAEAVPAGSDGLLFSPYLSGERTPHMNANAKGCFVGLTLSHTRAHMTRAIMEGVAYSLCDSLDIFRELGLPIEELLCYGGGTKSLTWRQILADVFEEALLWEDTSEQSATGAALACAEVEGLRLRDRGPARSSGVISLPRRENQELYRSRRRTYRNIYTQLAGVFEELSEFRPR
jgi:xylulokinase